MVTALKILQNNEIDTNKSIQWLTATGKSQRDNMYNKSVEVLERSDRSEDMLLSNSFSLLVDESKIKGQQAELICLEHEDKEASEQPNQPNLKAVERTN